jgi:hypothetical protein
MANAGMMAFETEIMNLRLSEIISGMLLISSVVLGVISGSIMDMFENLKYLNILKIKVLILNASNRKTKIFSIGPFTYIIP